jgi:hypothetical protein
MRSRAVLAGALLFAAVPAAAAAGDMSVATFLAKADALKAKGMMALMSSDIGTLRDEASAAGRAYRAKLVADKAAGRAPESCPPPKSSLGSDVLIAHLRSYPEAQRTRLTMKAAMANLLRKTFPCPSRAR